MDNILIISDIQAYRKEPYWFGIQKLFEEYLIPNYKDYILVHGGDFYEISHPHAEIRKKMTEYILNFKEVHTILGNHDISQIKGSGIEELKLHKNIFVYDKLSEVIIENLKCLMIPFSNKISIIEDYNKNLKGKYDLVFSHWTPKLYSFGSNYLDLKNIIANIGIFIAHIHIPKNYKEYDNNNYIIGTPQPTREGEQNFKPRIFLIEDNKLREEKLPIYVSIKNIEYGQLPENKDWIYNIKNAPSFQAVNDMYKDYYVRKEGITIKREENEIEFENSEKENKSLQEEFKVYSIEKGVSKEIINCCLEYLNKGITIESNSV